MDSNRNHAFSEKLKEQVNASFDRIRKALDLREKLLLRQLSVVVQQSHHVTFQFDNIKFVDGGGEEDLVSRIRTYGRYNIDNFNIILKDPYENEDYIQPVDDHDLMHKSCRRGVGEEEHNPESEEIVVEFFNNKSLIKEGAEMVRESIINLALNESKELIDRTFGGVSMGLELDEELEQMKIDLTNCRNRERRTVDDSLSLQGEGAPVDISNNNVTSTNQDDDKGIEQAKVARSQHMITKASQTELDKIGRHSITSNSQVDSSVTDKSTKMDRNMKNVSTLTMNNCGGTINLKNVTNLTINTCSDTPGKQVEQSVAPPCPSEEGSPECGFYKRLITENKILRQHILKTTLSNVTPQAPISQTSSGSDSPSINTEPSPMDNLSTSSGSASNCNKPKRLALTAAELRAVLNLPQQDSSLTHVLGDLFALASPTTVAGKATAAESGTQSQEHTMQIQQWLKQIISETETEPVQNAEMMEFSHINN
ncbi:uncharacterized protein LOC134211524 [Armigeres subalbatus]|uniref:uncharacterized protein LOC134211524 n=1 Tax=Armigeres subalbatus TaxID=124917 RepID=UPI002ED441AC